ncbi:hypothetical protein BBJ28_00016848 [Nothophytophthora sp. Chile5]|nr:hypothetical protein BBJ28_00016848 [Nothophytophthora sp. Chile5]
MKTVGIKGLLALALLALLGVANADVAVQETEDAARELQVADFSTKLLNAVNAKRSAKGLAAVCINKKLMKAAQVLADDMAKNNFVGTKGTDGSTPTTRAKAQHMAISSSAELVAAGQSSADSVVETWIKSSSAYIYSDLPFIGPGYKYDKTKTYKHYWVLDFADGEGEVCA